MGWLLIASQGWLYWVPEPHARVSYGKSTSMSQGWAEAVLFVVMRASLPHREAEGAFLQQGPCFCTKEPIPRPLPATAPPHCFGMQRHPLVAAAFWKWAWSLSRNISGLAVTMTRFRLQGQLQATWLGLHVNLTGNTYYKYISCKKNADWKRL